MQTQARPVTLRNMPAGVSTLSSDGWAQSEHLLCIPTFVLTAPRLRPRERAKDRFWAAVTAERLADMAQRLSQFIRPCLPPFTVTQPSVFTRCAGVQRVQTADVFCNHCDCRLA